MKRVFSFGIISAVCASVLIAGCAKAPQQESAAAKAAIESAKTANAPVFAAAQFNAAQEMVNAALADIKAQDAKSPFSRNYDKAKKMLVEATAAAEAAKAAVGANKAKIIEEAKALLEKAKAAVEESRKLIAALEKKKNKNVVELKTKLEAAAASLPADLAKVSDDALVATHDVIKNAVASVESVKASIEQLSSAKPVAKNKKKGKK
jgi:hypothetical protein